MAAELPLIALLVILAFSTILHLTFLIKDPGSSYVQIPAKQLYQMVEKGKLTINDAKLKEHTWKYGSRDAYLYAKMANQIIEHGVYGFDTYNSGKVVQNAFVTPGYPFYLVVIFSAANLFHIDQVQLTILVNMLLSLSTILILYLISVKIFKNQWIGIIAAAAYATYFPPLHYFRSTLTEVPGIFFYCLAFYLFLVAYERNQYRYHFFFAVVFNYAIFIRPVLAPIILFAFILIVMKNKRDYLITLKIVGFWVLGALLIAVPWVIRNYIVFDQFILFSTQAGNSWLGGANPFFLYDFSDYYRDRKALGMDQEEYAYKKIREGFQTKPSLWFSWFTVGKTYELFKLPDGIYFYKHWTMTYFKYQHQLLVLIAFLTMIIARRKEVAAVIIIVVAYIGFSNLFLTIPRYGYYISPILCILVGYALVTTSLKLRGFGLHVWQHFKVNGKSGGS
jgi:4-amino-4-deoxy-L-arabinose transferase-like glycosyltransferase